MKSKRTVLITLFLMFNVTFYFGQEIENQPLKIIKPTPLFPGDTILFVAPSGSLDSTRMSLVKQRLEDRGYITIQATDLLREYGYLGGTDERRTEEFMNAWKEPSVKAIFPGTGGYGVTRILDDLDYNIIKQYPKILIGFSDITALHLAINKMTGLVTFHTPNPMYGLGGEDNLSPVSEYYFWQAIEGNNPNGYIIDLEPFGLKDSVITLNGGIGKGELTGGNLSLIATLMGTPYEIETDGKILFMEDVGEAPYRIDRYLSQIKLAGKFERVNGIILGKFTRREDEPPDDENSFSMMEVFEQYFSDLNIPVLANFPIGHYQNNITFPIGVQAELDADNKLVKILESPTRLQK